MIVAFLFIGMQSEFYDLIKADRFINLKLLRLPIFYRERNWFKILLCS